MPQKKEHLLPLVLAFTAGAVLCALVIFFFFLFSNNPASVEEASLEVSAPTVSGQAKTSVPWKKLSEPWKSNFQNLSESIANKDSQTALAQHQVLYDSIFTDGKIALPGTCPLGDLSMALKFSLENGNFATADVVLAGMATYMMEKGMGKTY